MKPIPIGKIRDLAKVFREVCEDAPGAAVAVEVEGVFGLDKAGELNLAGIGEEDVPLDLPARAELSTKLLKAWQSYGVGRFLVRLERKAPTTRG